MNDDKHSEMKILPTWNSLSVFEVAEVVRVKMVGIRVSMDSPCSNSIKKQIGSITIVFTLYESLPMINIFSLIF